MTQTAIKVTIPAAVTTNVVLKPVRIVSNNEIRVYRKLNGKVYKRQLHFNITYNSVRLQSIIVDDSSPDGTAMSVENEPQNI